MSKRKKHGAFTHLEGELAWTIAEHRTPSDAIETTRKLVEADESEHELLGLSPDCERAIFWDDALRGVRTAGFDADGVEELSAADTDGPRRKGEYLQREGVADWAWVHPRHRWLRNPV
ncbi:hypothetical protein [Halorarum halobium]|uniref:hypothetical protein n=1 Tax=Halorarum halobium TaxID=3075121 RepID=UPI0028ADE8C7|nr:hypothetical protein [Halobaculum sp. XH14]